MPGPGTGQGKKKTMNVGVRTDKTRRKDASSPSKTRMNCVALALLSPCMHTVTKMKAQRAMANGKI